MQLFLVDDTTRLSLVNSQWGDLVLASLLRKGHKIQPIEANEDDRDEAEMERVHALLTEAAVPL